MADLRKKSKLGSALRLTPGRYEMLATSPTRGFSRFALTVRPGQHRTVRLQATKNLAAEASGATVIGATTGSLNPGSLIDGPEKTA